MSPFPFHAKITLRRKREQFRQTREIVFQRTRRSPLVLPFILFGITFSHHALLSFNRGVRLNCEWWRDIAVCGVGPLTAVCTLPNGSVRHGKGHAILLGCISAPFGHGSRSGRGITCPSRRLTCRKQTCYPKECDVCTDSSSTPTGRPGVASFCARAFFVTRASRPPSTRGA